VKIGDLVRYNSSLFGLEDCVGLIVAENGEAFDIQWTDHNGQTGRVYYPGDTPQISTELREFLEVVNENR